MSIAAADSYSEPAVGLAALDDANLLAGFFEDWALLDVKLEMGAQGISGGRAGDVSDVAKSLEFRLDGGRGVEDVRERVGLLERNLAGPYTGSHHGFGKSGAFFTVEHTELDL